MCHQRGTFNSIIGNKQFKRSLPFPDFDNLHFVLKWDRQNQTISDLLTRKKADGIACHNRMKFKSPNRIIGYLYSNVASFRLIFENNDQPLALAT